MKRTNFTITFFQLRIILNPYLEVWFIFWPKTKVLENNPVDIPGFNI
jgi:hypothetical protein